MTTMKQKRRTREERVASNFRYDSKLEDLLRMKKNEREKYDSLPPTIHSSVGYYLSAKRAARAQGIDVSNPERRKR